MEKDFPHLKKSDLKVLQALESIGQFEATPDSPASAADTKRIVALTMRDSNLEDIKLISRLTELRHLDLSGNAKLADIAKLQKLKKLQVLNLQDCPQLDLTDLRELRSLHGLKWLAINDQPSLRDVSGIKHMQNLEFLCLWGCTSLVEDNVFEVLQALPSLKFLDIRNGSILSLPAQIVEKPELEIAGLVSEEASAENEEAMEFSTPSPKPLPPDEAAIWVFQLVLFQRLHNEAPPMIQARAFLSDGELEIQKGVIKYINANDKEEAAQEVNRCKAYFEHLASNLKAEESASVRIFILGNDDNPMGGSIGVSDPFSIGNIGILANVSPDGIIFEAIGCVQEDGDEPALAVYKLPDRFIAASLATGIQPDILLTTNDPSTFHAAAKNALNLWEAGDTQGMIDMEAVIQTSASTSGARGEATDQEPSNIDEDWMADSEDEDELEGDQESVTGIYMGIDIGKGKWVCASLEVAEDGSPENIGSYLVEFDEDPEWGPCFDLALFDVPIGLTPDSESKATASGGRSGDRPIDKGARKWCRSTSSVFPPPTIGQYESGMAEHRRSNAAGDKKRVLSKVHPKGLSQQGLEMIPAIQSAHRWKDIRPGQVFESHPEVIFSYLADGNIKHSKKTVEGIEERCEILSALLAKHGFQIDVAQWADEKARAFSVRNDDWIDALALAYTAFSCYRDGRRQVLSDASGTPNDWSGRDDQVCMVLPVRT